MTVEKLKNELNLKAVCLADPEREIEGGYVGDLLSWVMGKAQSGNVWITIMSNMNIIAVASLTDVACIVLAEGVQLDENVVNTAKLKEINVLQSDKSAFDLAAEISDLI
ncbi:MAG: hypothetical protein IJU39_01855 [Clostridia bacterium]|nr:hypothetical protein [Clostridia bacterium]